METMQCLEQECSTPPPTHTQQGFVPCNSAHQAQDLAGGEELPGGRQIHALRRHAVQAAQVAALRQRDAQVAVPPPVSSISLRGQLRSGARRAPHDTGMHRSWRYKEQSELDADLTKAARRLYYQQASLTGRCLSGRRQAPAAPAARCGVPPPGAASRARRRLLWAAAPAAVRCLLKSSPRRPGTAAAA
jgi:hypothetical protein